MNANASWKLAGTQLAVRAAQQRRAQPVGVLVEILQRDALGAEEAAR